MIDLVDKAVHDIIEQRHLLAVEIPRAGNKQVRYLTQDFGSRANISLRNRCFQLINHETQSPLKRSIPPWKLSPAYSVYVAFMMQDQQVVETDIPARLDRLPWGRFHTLVVAALGITWILDGLEVTLAGSLAGALKTSLHLSNTDIGIASSAYLAGAVLGALFFGWLTDRLGRKKLFFITLSVYLVATAATAVSWSMASFALFRFLTGRRYRRRVCGDQFDNPGACPGACARLDRSRDQRKLLDRRSFGRDRFTCIA